MALNFVGQAKKIQEKDFVAAAAALGCDVAAVKAVTEVESSGGGFFKNKQPKVLFESRWFGKLTNSKYHRSHPDISTPNWVHNYKRGSAEYTRLEKAIKLNREAALKATSWGMFQILGVNHNIAGFATVEAFVKAEMVSEAEHLKAFVNFVKSKKLDDELRDLRWADFAQMYNGPGYRKNHYDEKMARAYEKYSGGVLTPSTHDVQIALNKHGFSLTADGVTGPRTRAAIMQFQTENSLASDGIAGPQTLAALGLVETADPIAMSRALHG